MRTIIWFIYFGLYLVFVLPKTKRVEKMLREGKQEEAAPIIEETVKTWSRRLLRLAGVTSTVDGLEHIPDEPALFVANHQGNFDIPLMLCEIGSLKSMVAKKEMQKIPVIRTWMKFFDCIFMDRDDPRQSLQCLNQAQKLLQSGKSVMIFPEGTRGKGSPIREFKSGAFRCALKSGAPVVPVVINGSYKAMEAQGNRIKPAHVRITILPPVPTKEMEKEHTKTISEDVRRLIESTLAEQTGLSSEPDTSSAPL